MLLESVLQGVDEQEGDDAQQHEPGSPDTKGQLKVARYSQLLYGLNTRCQTGDLYNHHPKQDDEENFLLGVL